MIYLMIDSISKLAITEPLDENEVSFRLDKKQFIEEDIKNIIHRLIDIRKQGYKVSFIISAEQRNFTNDEFAILMTLEKELNKNGFQLYFDGGYKDYYFLEDVMKTDKVLDEFIYKLNNNGLSPFEKYLAIYRYLTKRKYHAESIDDDHETVHLSRDIISVMNTDYIVCAGYAELMQYFCTNVGIECFAQPIECEKENHMNNLVNIYDGKYNIHGIYYADACWDARNDFEIALLNYCLLPLDDVKHLNILMMVMPDYIPFYRVRSYKALNGISSAGEEAFYKPYIIEKYGLSKEINALFEKCMRVFLRDKDEATRTLLSLYREQDIEDNFYEFIMSVPYGMSIPFLLALLLVSKKNKETVRYLIKELKRYVELDMDKMEASERPLYPCETFMEANISIPLEEGLGYLRYGLNYQKVELSYSGLEKYLYYDLDFERVDLDRRYYEIVFKTVCYMTNMIIYPKIEKIIEKDYPLGNPISIDKYEKALENALKIEGLSKEEIKKIVKATINTSIRKAKTMFDEEAINDFYLHSKQQDNEK